MISVFLIKICNLEVNSIDVKYFEWVEYGWNSGFGGDSYRRVLVESRNCYMKVDNRKIIGGRGVEDIVVVLVGEVIIMWK